MVRTERYAENAREERERERENENENQKENGREKEGDSKSVQQAMCINLQISSAAFFSIELQSGAPIPRLDPEVRRGI